jgi:hypothetical protein
LDILLDLMGADFTSFLSAGPQIARVIRVLRVSRLFKLIKSESLKGIMKIFKTLAFSFPSLLNVLVLLCLVYFIFAILAVNLFGADLKFNEKYNNEVTNFKNFHNAFIILVGCSTGEDWHLYMFTVGDNDGKYITARVFFLLYIFISDFIMLKMFQSVLMEQFEIYYFDENNPLNVFSDLIQPFNSTWNLYTIKEKG